MATTRPEPIYFRALESQPWQRGDREATSEWQNARMLHAMTRAVSEKGYAKVTVADIVALAGVSRRTFYEHFKDVEDCFVSAYEAGTGGRAPTARTPDRTGSRRGRCRCPAARCRAPRSAGPARG